MERFFTDWKGTPYRVKDVPSQGDFLPAARPLQQTAIRRR
jgi:hypothetical protein